MNVFLGKNLHTYLHILHTACMNKNKITYKTQQLKAKTPSNRLLLSWSLAAGVGALASALGAHSLSTIKCQLPAVWFLNILNPCNNLELEFSHTHLAGTQRG